ncbi:hypothetical protein AF72_05800 [Xylella taiwanensis]|uniref:Uncharacterized protein n=1 Tax=Xylella taiwanensis TaxID=1444770 RepID=Z9JJC8_9GAMM|nr:hypothetical protein AF72_05800 [Xylella taiwanensis]
MAVWATVAARSKDLRIFCPYFLAVIAPHARLNASIYLALISKPSPIATTMVEWV